MSCADLSSNLRVFKQIFCVFDQIKIRKHFPRLFTSLASVFDVKVYWNGKQETFHFEKHLISFDVAVFSSYNTPVFLNWNCNLTELLLFFVIYVFVSLHHNFFFLSFLTLCLFPPCPSRFTLIITLIFSFASFFLHFSLSSYLPSLLSPSFHCPLIITCF